MAESTLSVSINTLKRDVAVLLGWPRTIASWSATQNTDFQYIMDSALRTFYFPPVPGGQIPYYEWTFLRTANTITLLTNDFDYNLPDNFGGVIMDDNVTFAVGQDRRNLKKVPEAEIRKLRSTANTTGQPKYFAVQPKAHNYTTGQRWEMLVYPTPNTTINSLVLHYRYVFIPETLNTTNKYPVGGGQYSEVIRESFLAQAELFLDDTHDGPHAKRFQELLITAIRADEQQKSNNRGGVS